MRIRVFWAMGVAILVGTSGCVSPSHHATQDVPLDKPLVAFQSTRALSDSDRLATEAVNLVSENRLAEASQKINVALGQRIDRSYYHLLNGFIYHLISRSSEKKGSEKGSYDLAKQGYEMAIKFDGGNWLAHYLLGRLLIETGDFGGAQKHFAEAMSVRKDDPEILGSLIYASYRNNAPDIAAGAVKALDAMGTLKGRDTELRNATMVMSALGEYGQAEAYLNQLRQVTNNSALLSHLQRRMEEWREFYAMEPKLRTVDFGISPTPGVGVPGVGIPGVGIPGVGGVVGTTTPTAPGTEGKMVVVDVVMILTEENLQSSRGVNLLNGLKLQFGDANLPAYQWKQTKGFASDAENTQARTITRALTIPAISYTLNIMNANSKRNEILARPTLVALAGESSEFFSGVDLTAAAVSGANNGQGGQPVQIQKLIGVKLVISPTFLDRNHLRINVNAERSFLNSPSANVDFSYKLETTLNKVTSSVVMRYGETLILAGLSEKEAERNNDSVPGLREIPIMQYLFSQDAKADFQKSVLILITPHQPQYVYQSENARQEYEKTLNEDERPLANLRARYADWFKPYPNWASVFHHLQENSLYREFRTGDVDLETWADMRSIRSRLDQIKDFLYY
ncbi:MAG: hypothetical protein HQL64_02890 [Magnetococcales bacterium]|nr:hypothetical protein [Magnetococcales bacterium]